MTDHQDKEYLEKLEKVVESPEEVQESPSVIRLENGVVIQMVSFYRGILAVILKQYPEPKVPIYFNPDKEREEENPADPDYIKAVEDHTNTVINAMLDVGIARGTELVSVPKGISKPSDKDWQEEVEELLRYKVPSSARLRYLHWLKWVATETDLKKVFEKVIGSFGVTEAAVEEEMARFPSDEERSTDL